MRGLREVYDKEVLNKARDDVFDFDNVAYDENGSLDRQAKDKPNVQTCMAAIEKLKRRLHETEVREQRMERKLDE